MWTCPKCGREFKKNNQGHYCGEAPQTVSEYIESQTLEARSHLNGIRQILQKVPSVKEYILWSMPYYEKEGKTLSFYACKNHVSFYVGEEIIEKFKEDLNGFVTKKNSVYFPYNKELPVESIERITNWYFSNK